MKTLPAFFLLSLYMSFSALFAQTNKIETLQLWPSDVPGEMAAKAPPEVSTNSSGDVKRLSRVTDPVLEVFAPASDKANGAAVVICPGGGYQILAIDKEGYEVAEWLAGLGYTAFVLQYRVPANREGALQDVQRAIRLVRHATGAYKVDPEKVAVLGFSAGGHLAARAATYRGDNTYAAVDGADEFSAQPNAAVLIYPAYLDEGPAKSLSPGLTLDEQTPPSFLFVAADDPYSGSSMVFGEALREKKLTVELHMVPQGGHGYGMREGIDAAETWPTLAEKWLANWLLNEGG